MGYIRYRSIFVSLRFIVSPIAVGFGILPSGYLRREKSFLGRRARQFLLLYLILCGDVELNPGPVQFPCDLCGRAVRLNDRGIQCDSCNSWIHAKCERNKV